jgi:hypothetical protein
MQYVDCDKIKDICSIGMEFLENEPDYADQEERDEFKLYSLDQENLKSLRSLPGIFDFLQDCLDTEPENLPLFVWTHKIH